MKNTSRKREDRERMKRKELWPEITEGDLWHRKRCDGYTTIPRTLPLMLSIMDEMAGKGRPVSRTYLTLWGRVHDEALVRLTDENMAALESGFSGNRRTTGWRMRMRILKELGFIDAKESGSGEFTNVLVMNPHRVIKKHWTSATERDGFRLSQGKYRISEDKYRALYDRADEVGAIDFLEHGNTDDDENVAE